MAKKLTDTNKWDKEWFQNLSAKHKCLWIFLCDRCNNAGIWDVNYRLASFLIGETINEDDLKVFGDRIYKISDAKILLPDYVYFQCGMLSEDSKPHLSVIKLLKECNLHFDTESLKVFYSLPDSLPGSLSDTLPGRLPGSLPNKEKEKEKDYIGKVQNFENEKKSDFQKEAMNVISYAKSLKTVSKLKQQLTLVEAEGLVKEFGFKAVIDILDSMQAWDEKKLLKKSDVASIARVWLRKDKKQNPSLVQNYYREEVTPPPVQGLSIWEQGYRGETANP